MTTDRMHTERASAADFFREAEDTYPALVQSPLIAIIAADDENRIIFWNTSAEKLFGRERGTVMGKPLEEVAGVDQQEGRWGGKGEKAIVCEEYVTTVNTGNGRLAPVAVYRSVRMSATGRVSTYVLRDMSNERRYESEMARLSGLNVVGQLASAMGHEVRNPMTTVRGFLQLLSRKDSDHRAYYDMMISEIDRADAIISQYLSLARGRTPELVPDSLAAIVQGMELLMEALAIEQGKRVVVDVGKQPLPLLLLNSHEIKQLVMNLVRNALEASPAGGTVTVAVSGGAREVVLQVGDNGPGIPEELLDKLGTPFLTTKPKGHGLGLAVCYQIADRHKASIKVESDPATGTTFSIFFPLR